MAMWDPYIASVRQHLAEAAGKIVFDKFHIAGHLSEAVDSVRRREHKQLKTQGDLRLAGSKDDWLRHPARFSDEAWREFQVLRDSNLKTARAWAMKETLMCLFDYRYEGAARNFFRRWYWWASHSRLLSLVEVARMLKRRLRSRSRSFNTRSSASAALLFALQRDPASLFCRDRGRRPGRKQNPAGNAPST